MSLHRIGSKTIRTISSLPNIAWDGRTESAETFTSLLAHRHGALQLGVAQVARSQVSIERRMGARELAATEVSKTPAAGIRTVPGFLGTTRTAAPSPERATTG
ncbi:MAG: hypothetical protein JSR31_01855 [Nitrospira sp.]|nr:hypothetical protein [Nitrospira sp.]